MLKTSSGLFSKFPVADRSKTRSKSITVIKSSKPNPPPTSKNMSKAMTQIYSQNLSPGFLTKNIIEAISPKALNNNKINSSIKIEKQKKPDSRVKIPGASEILIKNKIYKKRSKLDSVRKQKLQESSIILSEDHLSSTLPSCYTVKSSNSVSNSDLSKSKISLLASSQNKDSSKKNIFQVYNKKSFEFKEKLLVLFDIFKTNHYVILNQFSAKRF